MMPPNFLLYKLKTADNIDVYSPQKVLGQLCYNQGTIRVRIDTSLYMHWWQRIT